MICLAEEAAIATPLEAGQEVQAVITGQVRAQAAAAAHRAWVLAEVADVVVVAGADSRVCCEGFSRARE